MLFSRSAKVEVTRKSLFNNRKSDLSLLEAFNFKVTSLLESTGLPYFKIDERKQRGTSFGGRLRNAIEQIYNEGFEKVIIIGNDCIELQRHHLLEANIKLQTNKFVLGADFNGGAYLIGVSKSVFDGNTFEAVSWQKRSVFDELYSLFGKHQSALLSCLIDCNTIADFKKAANNLSYSDSFRCFFLSLFQRKSLLILFETTTFSIEFCLLQLNKGSPFSSLIQH